MSIHKPSKCCNKSSMMMMHRLSNTCLYTRQWKMRPAGMRLATSTETTTGWDRSPYAATSTSTTLTATLNLVRDADFASCYSTAAAYLTRLLFFSCHSPSLFAFPHRAQAVDQENGFVGRRWVRPEFEAAGPELLREPLVPAGILRHQDGPA